MKKILLVEDDKSLQEIYGLRLEAEGYKISFANDGEEAISMVAKEQPDLILTDVMMPRVSGFDMLEILKENLKTNNAIKVIIMTALSSEDQRIKGEKLEVDKFLVKSQVGIEDVINAVNEVLSDQPQPTPVVATDQSLEMVEPTNEINYSAPLTVSGSVSSNSVSNVEENTVENVASDILEPAQNQFQATDQPLINNQSPTAQTPSNIVSPDLQNEITASHNETIDNQNNSDQNYINRKSPNLSDIIPPRR